ncbi:MAG TPA: nitroreductase, partial [Candidatus Tectomicrobia bacterium]
ARQIFEIPDGYEAWTGLAIGYRGDPATLPDDLQERDRTPRQRKPLNQFVFSGKWGDASPLVLKR